MSSKINDGTTQEQETTADNILLESQVKPSKKVNPWKDIPKEQWEDWHWQLKNRITKLEQLKELIDLTSEEENGIVRSSGRLAMTITPYWTLLMHPSNANCPIRKQSVPSILEHLSNDSDMTDPCGEDKDSPAPGLVHRYPDRVLLLATDNCAMYCRHCTRRRRIGKHEEVSLNDLDKAIDYIRKTRSVRDVLISGGDPFLLETEYLENIVKKVREIPHVEFLRIGTRVPISLPQRITQELVDMLKKYAPIWISIHVNHPKELSRRAKAACDMLSDNGFPLGSQTVLLKGVNDRAHVMKKLMHELLKARIRPYYIYQCDPARGTSHFRTPISVGINIMEKLRGFTSGYAVPTYVVDAPGGGGKIPVSPNYMLSQAKGKYILRNFKGRIYTYKE